MDAGIALQTALEQRSAERDPVHRVKRYMDGHHDESYMPKSYEQEFRKLVQRAIGNWLPLVVDTLSQTLYVEGYRRADDPENGDAWRYWTLNGLDSRQNLVHRSALTYGTAYVSVLPGDRGPAIRVHSPLTMTVVQEDPDAEWPDYAIRRVRTGKTPAGDRFTVWELIDADGVWLWQVPDGAEGPAEYDLLAVEDHGQDICPVVVFRNRWPDDPDTGITQLGEIEQLIPIQDRLNDTTVGLLVAQQYSAFKQKWATGIHIPRGQDGRPVESFEAAANRVWMTESKDVTFGEFSETTLSGYLASQESAIKHMSAIAQVPPHYLLGGLVNISAEALAAAEAGLTRKANERKTLFGEAWGRVFRLAAAVAGDIASAEDPDARVIWRDTEARSLSASADALGKLATSLQIPVESLWEMIPGVSPFQLREWREARAQNMAGSAAEIAAALISGDDTRMPVGESGGAEETPEAV